MSDEKFNPPIFKHLNPKDQAHLTTVHNAQVKQQQADNMTSEQTWITPSTH